MGCREGGASGSATLGGDCEFKHESFRTCSHCAASQELTYDVYHSCIQDLKTWLRDPKRHKKSHPVGVTADFLSEFSFGAGDAIRTRDIYLGKVVLYQLSYSRVG